MGLKSTPGHITVLFLKRPPLKNFPLHTKMHLLRLTNIVLTLLMDVILYFFKNLPRRVIICLAYLLLAKNAVTVYLEKFVFFVPSNLLFSFVFNLQLSQNSKKNYIHIRTCSPQRTAFFCQNINWQEPNIFFSQTLILLSGNPFLLLGTFISLINAGRASQNVSVSRL